MFIPTNEQGVIVLFAALAPKYGWEIVSIQTAYPDAVLRDKSGREWLTEFEFSSSNFLDHKHDHRGCDLIVCWKHDYIDGPLPVIELSSESFGDVVQASVAQKAAEYWMRRCLRAEKALRDKHADSKIMRTLTDVLLAGKRTKIDARREKLLAIVRSEPSIELAELQRRLDVGSVNTVKSDIETLVALGRITFENRTFSVCDNGE